jgi:hypothetical protein
MMVLDAVMGLLRKGEACGSVAEWHWAAARKPFRREAMEPLEFIRVAAVATASALAVFGAWQIVGEIIRLSDSTGGSLIQDIVAVLHPGVWYVLAAVVIRQLGRQVSG